LPSGYKLIGENPLLNVTLLNDANQNITGSHNFFVIGIVKKGDRAEHCLENTTCIPLDSDSVTLLESKGSFQLDADWQIHACSR
jgi:hypothetical protein